MNKTFFRLLAISIATFLVSASAQADETATKLPSSDKIRRDYQESSERWTVLPMAVQLAFAAAEDRHHFEKLPQNSKITLELSRYLLTEVASNSQQTDKLHRYAVSLVIGKTLTSDEVLNWYVNRVYLGQACYGVVSAASAYFGKTVDTLQLEEIAYLAALPKGPSVYHPLRSHSRALERRNFVLSEMRKAGFISESEAKTAQQSDLAVQVPLDHCRRK